MKPKAVMNWSGGKDSSLALHHILNQSTYDIVALLTTINQQYKRISMHGVRESLLEQQAQSIGLPLIKVFVDDKGTMQSYEEQMQQAMSQLKSQGVTVSIFGDIFLEDLRQYREKQLHAAGFQAHFPLWKQNTTDLAEQFVDLGFKGVTTCISSAKLDREWVGRSMDASFFNNLPADVDACGENGEYHSFIHDGPHMKHPIHFTLGETLHREYAAPDESVDDDCPCGSDNSPANMGFWYTDLVPK